MLPPVLSWAVKAHARVRKEIGREMIWIIAAGSSLYTDVVQLNYKLWSGVVDCLKEHNHINVIEYILGVIKAER